MSAKDSEQIRREIAEAERLRAAYEKYIQEHPPEQVPTKFVMTDQLRKLQPRWRELMQEYGKPLPIPILPVAGDVRLTSVFGERDDPIKAKDNPNHRHANDDLHGAHDYAPARDGANIPVIASMPGMVLQMIPEKYSGGLGNVVYVIGFDNCIYQYAHLRNFERMKPGDPIDQGNRIGIMGNTGKSTGTHLHYGVITYAGRDKDGDAKYVYVNPDVNGQRFDKSQEGNLQLAGSQEVPRNTKDARRMADAENQQGHGLSQMHPERGGQGHRRS